MITAAVSGDVPDQVRGLDSLRQRNGESAVRRVGVTDEAISDLANRVLARAGRRPDPCPPPTRRRAGNRRTPRRRRTVVTRRGWPTPWCPWSPTGAGGRHGHRRIWGEWASRSARPWPSTCVREAFDRTTGRLTLRADSTAWATQVRMLSGQLRKRLQGRSPVRSSPTSLCWVPMSVPNRGQTAESRAGEPATPTAERRTRYVGDACPGLGCAKMP